jgi:hypothetical protein
MPRCLSYPVLVVVCSMHTTIFLRAACRALSTEYCSTVYSENTVETITPCIYLLLIMVVLVLGESRGTCTGIMVKCSTCTGVSVRVICKARRLPALSVHGTSTQYHYLVVSAVCFSCTLVSRISL